MTSSGLKPVAGKKKQRISDEKSSHPEKAFTDIMRGIFTS